MSGVVDKSRQIARRGLVILAVTATMAISGVAFASWTLSGTGTGSAEAAVAESLTATVSISANLYPGLTTNADIQIVNPNNFPVVVTAVTFTGDVQVAAPAGECTPANSAVTFTTVSGLDLTIEPNETKDFAGALENAVAMGLTSHTDCQGRTFSRPFTLTAAIDN